MKTITELERKDAMHLLECRHAIGTHGYDYYMDCVILKEMPNNKLKILVFGERSWKGHDEKKRIRYVDSYRVREKRK